jgi:hypothetical protein
VSDVRQPERESFETLPCERATEFIALLRPTNPQWLAERDARCNWIFRGQPDAVVDLTPTAWRASALTHPLRRQIDGELAKEGVLQNYAQQAQLSFRANDADFLRAVIGQRLFEYTVVQEFIAGIDHLGLPIPGGASSLPAWTEDIFDVQQTFFRGRTTFHPAFALARHHRMPSRLLDWTANPLVAAFFASEPCDPALALSDSVAVWACNRNVQSERGRPPVLLYVPERSAIGFLHAQDGLFTFIARASSHFHPTRGWPRFEDCAIPKDLVKVTLPKSEIPNLRRLLSAEGINRPKLMPTHDNVAAWLNQQWEGLP